MVLIREILLAARPKYRRQMGASDSLQRRKSMDSNGIAKTNERESLRSTKLSSEQSITLKRAIQQYTPMQVVDGMLDTNSRTNFLEVNS